MSKGDKITVLVATPSGAQEMYITASKAGRSLTTKAITRQKIAMIQIDEVTRTKRPTGNRLTIRADALLATIEIASDVPDAPAKPRKAPNLTTPMDLS